MKRDNAILLHFQKAAELTVSKMFYRDHITELFQWMIKADAVENDSTSKTLAISGKGKTQIITRQVGVIAGLEEIQALLTKKTKLVFMPKVSDGTRVSKDTVVAEVAGENTDLLAYERTILNILGRMSGIATETDTLVSLLKHIPVAPFIAALRKTSLMFLDKKAVAVGGGLTHRLNLSDEILIKDNHLGMLKKAMRFKTSEQAAEEAVRKCMQSAKNYFEIEVDTLSQANAILHVFVQENNKLKEKKMMTILLDNFKTQDATRFASSLKKLPVYDSILIEASGEITARNLSEWATTGVDVVSLGALTHSPKVFNFSMSY
jgi:nicotinate-nucleotide pyrophosphorylase (carboxylating)